ncbi:MAG: hypothetical protein GF317_18295 [Candidatus Lokiarchaeota archaeon]|nr:hypothetical protein [Candidatus Lokiarchaeota archaeon]MBD3201465.1 hypothetical protein [Candidatus Lokiarchaeota archaeon]
MGNSCIICHMQTIEGLDKIEKCPNGHIVHFECLKEWLIHSLNCPLCNDKYSPHVISKFDAYLSTKEREKEEAFKRQLEEKELKEIQKIGDKMVFLKFVKSIENLIELEKYEDALERLELYDQNQMKDYQGQTAVFLKGKINYIRGRYDMAIANLFKLVKKNFSYPKAFYYLGKSYKALGLDDKAKWAFERVPETKA